MENAPAAQTAEDLRLVTHVTAAKSVANRRTLAQGVVRPATKSHVSAPVPTASNPTAYAARIVESIRAHAENITSKVKRKSTMSLVKNAN